MSNALAIAAVTSTLQQILQRSLVADLPPTSEINLGNPAITTAPLDRARKSRENVHQLNLYLFQVVPNAQLRNLDIGGARSPVALELHYLITAFAAGDDDRAAHMLLGQAMRILNDHAILGPTELQQSFKGNDLAEQIDGVRLTPRAISLEDLGRVWAMAQTQARLSIAYVASVVLIDSTTPRRTPLPVLRRGAADRGVQLVLSNIPGPQLLELSLPQDRSFTLLGDALELTGQQLRAPEVRVRLVHPRLAAPIDLTPANTSTATRILAQLPNTPATLPAGVYGLSVALRDPNVAGSERTTGAFSLPLAPEITTSPIPPAKRNAQGVVSVTLDVRPAVLPAQQVALLVGDREVPAPARPNPTQRLTFTFASPVGEFLLRLRVDGVDSDVVVRTANAPPTFNPALRLVVTA